MNTPAPVYTILSEDDTFAIAQALAADLAEDELCANIGEMMIQGGREKAQRVRAAVEANTGPYSSITQEYMTIRRSVYGALWAVLRGYKGYRLVKENPPSSL